jgi:hypothetical protein
VLPLIFLAAVNGQCIHTEPKRRGAVRMTLTLSSSAQQLPALATAVFIGFLINFQVFLIKWLFRS